MKHFDLFSGYGGFALACERNGIQTIGFSEIDKYASSVLKYHWPKIKNYGDITKIKTEELPDFDLLTGGSPCQDLSIAGKRKGLAGERSGLFYHYIRILKEKQPKYFIWENVKGALSSNQGRDFADILSEMAEAGYSVQWQVLNAKDFGVPQNRERIFVVGTRGGSGREIFFERGNDKKDNELSGQSTNTVTARYYGGQENGSYIIESEFNAQKIRQLNNPIHSNDRVYSEEGLSPCLNTMQGGLRQPFIKIKEATKLGYAIARGGDSINLAIPNSKTRRGRVGKGIAQTLDCGIQQYTIVNPYNGKKSETETGTLGTTCGTTTGKTAQHLHYNNRIRRLTPRECERLMGLPDDWLKYGIDSNGKTFEVSDSQKYKMAGNGIVVNVVEKIIKELIR